MIVTFIVTMGSVYGLGRMLDVIKTRVGKNRVAFISCLLFGPLEVLGYIPKKVEGRRLCNNLWLRNLMLYFNWNETIQ